MERLADIGLSKSVTVGSRRTYSSHANTFIRFCKWLKVNPFQPVSERALCKLCWMWCRNNKVTSIGSWMSGIEYFCKQHKLPRLARGAEYATNLQALELLFGQLDEVQGAVAMTEEEVVRVCAQFEFLFGPQRAAELVAATVWCFRGLFRASEIAGRMLAGDVSVAEWGIEVVLPFSKAVRRPAKVCLVRTGGPLCPVAAFRDLLRVRGRLGGKDPLFRFSYDCFNSSLGKAAAQAGVVGVTTHSLRRSGATHMFLAGATAELIMAHGRWRSDCYRKYVDLGIKHLHQPPVVALLAMLAQSRSSH